MFKAVIKITVAASLYLIAVSGSFAQDVRVDTIKVTGSRAVNIASVMTVPKFILQLSAGYNAGALELTSHNGGFSRQDMIEGKNFGARNGFGISLIGKLPLHKKGRFWLDFIADFSRFQSNLFANNNQEGSASYNSFNGGIGVEYNFTSYHRVKFSFGANPLISVITGKASLINPDNDRVDVKIKPATRFGYSVFMGLEYAFDKNVGLNIGFKYTHANLIGKKTTEPGDNPSEIELNDGATTADNPISFGGWKQFAYVSAYAGFSYFFGAKIHRYKLP